MVRNIGFALVLALTAAVATAAPSSGDHQFLRAPQYTPASTNAGATTVTAVSAPEIDPASAQWRVSP
jgi:hypothetical protein